MRKIVLVLMISLLLVSIVSPVVGSNYRETALNYLTEKYDVSEERIELYEGGTMELEFTGESFWYARYMILAEGGSTSGSSRGIAPGQDPPPEPMPLPEPNTPPDSMPEILPMPSDEEAINRDTVDSKNYIYGGIYIHIKTGEILEQDKMEAYFVAEEKLAQKEWERLSKEAGKLDVSLYRKLKGLSSTEKISVWIQPTPVETEELKVQFAALKEKYPEFTKSMELNDILYARYAIDLPLYDTRGGGVSSSEGSDGGPVPSGDEAVSYIVLDDKTDPAQSRERIEAEILPIMPEEEYRQEYSSFWEELEQIRLQAVIPSLETIKETLDGMGITYSDNETSLVADLTVAQIHEIVELAAVSTVFEDAVFTTMDMAEDGALLARSSAPSEESAVAMESADNDKGTSSYLPVVLIALAVLAAAMVIYRRRIART